MADTELRAARGTKTGASINDALAHFAWLSDSVFTATPEWKKPLKLDVPSRSDALAFEGQHAQVQHFALTGRVAPLATPNDPLFSSQWHLTGANGINVTRVWDDYRGGGITIGFIDDGIEYTHPDLNDRYNASIDYDSYNGSSDGGPKVSTDRHATTTAGVAAAEGNNGQGVTGVAFEAGITSSRLYFGASISDPQLADLFNRQAQVDVSNNSWGFNGFFTDNFQSWTATRAALENVAANGRSGLGTTVVFAAGNSRESGDNVNYHNLQNSKYTIAVAATDANGHYTTFSTPGAALLVSAPGLNITSTDRVGSAGYVNGDYVSGLAGTSYSAPIVSGVVALMLDANPNLGYRDVQEILAYSARNSDAAHAGWQINGAGNWNGGGLHFSHDYGFGLVNAHAAVRLSETWQLQSTFANMESADSGVLSVNASIPDGSGNVARSFGFSDTGLRIDHVEVLLNLAHGWIGDLQVTLTSPSGTVSTLVTRPGVNPTNPSGYGSSADNINFTLQSNAFWGELADGAWTIQVSDVDGGYAGTFQNWRLRVYGDSGESNDVFVYTDEFSIYATAARTLLSDAGGTDTINVSAVTSNSTLSLAPGTNSLIDGVTLAIASGTLIENAFAGDGNDTVTGNDAANTLDGGRGDDLLEGAAGNDILLGGFGVDTARYLGAFLEYLITILTATSVRIEDTAFGNGNEGTDTVSAVEKFLFGSEIYLFNGSAFVLEGPPVNAVPNAVNDAATGAQNTPLTINVLSNDTDPDGGDILDVTGIVSGPGSGTAILNASDTITYTPNADWFGTDSFVYAISDGHGGSDSAQVTVTIMQDAARTISGNGSSETLTGGSGNDTIRGNAGNDVLYGKGGNDDIQGGTGSDTVYGGSGNDLIRGGTGNDVLYGDAGNDTLYSDGGNDRFIGGAGADLLVGYNFGKDIFEYGSLGDAGDIISGFRRGQDVLDLRPLQLGFNPVANGILQFQSVSGDLLVKIDTDGAGAGSPVLLTTLDNVSFTTLTPGTDYWV